MLQLEHSGNFRNLFLSFPAKPGLPTAPQYSTSKARAPHSPPAKYQQSQGSPQPPSTVPAKPGLPIAPSTVPVKPGLHTAPQHSTSEARAPHSPPAQYQPPGTITGTVCLSPVPEEAPSYQGPSQGLPASLQCQKKLPATRDHHRDCLPLSSARRSSQLPGTITGTACLSPAPEEAPSHQGPPQGLPVISEHSLDIYTFKLETS